MIHGWINSEPPASPSAPASPAAKDCLIRCSAYVMSRRGCHERRRPSSENAEEAIRVSAACPSFARVEAATLTSRYGASHCSLRPGLAIARLATLLRCVTSRSRGDCLDRRSFPSCPRGAALQGATAGCRYACGRLALGFLRVDCYPAYRYDHPSLSFRSNAAGHRG